MKTDALDRRLRWEAPQPGARRVHITENDLLLFAAIDRHGPLPSAYLYEFTKHARCNYHRHQTRLTDLYHHGYLRRPKGQFNAFAARYQHLVYDLSDKARDILGDRLGCCPLKQSNEFVHDLMKACASASIELVAAERGIRFMDRAEITSRGCEAQRASNPLAIPVPGVDAILLPDDLFGLEYPSGEHRLPRRFFALEADRSTERIRGDIASAFAHKIERYSRVLRTKAFRTWWGVGNLHILTVTTSIRRARHISEEVKRQVGSDYANRFWFAVEPVFGSRKASSSDEFWRVPEKILCEVVSQQFMTVCG